MARRQLYDDVMDVALRATLKEYGFTRKTRRDYILERPDRIWIFELEMAPDPRPGFETMAAVCLPQFDEIFETHLPDFWRQGIASRNHAHVGTSIEKLMEIASGHDFYTMQRGPASRNWSEAYQKAQSDPVMQYQDHGYWVPPKYGDHLEQSHEQDMRDWKRGVRELGLFIDEQWRTHVWEASSLSAPPGDRQATRSARRRRDRPPPLPFPPPRRRQAGRRAGRVQR